MAGIVVIFDFDRTIIDGDSDNWVVTEMGLTQLFNDLRSTVPWNSLMVSFYSVFLFLFPIVNSYNIDCDGVLLWFIS